MRSEIRSTRYTVLTAALLALGACGQQSTTPGATVENVDLVADYVIDGFHMRLTNMGVVTTLLDSDTAYVDEQTRRYEFRGVTASFRDESGAEAGILTSRTGDYEQRYDVFVARGDVVLITEGPNGERRLESDELHYDIRGDRLWTEGAFVLREAGRTTRGDRLETDSKFQRWEVVGVQTQGTPGEGGISF